MGIDQVTHGDIANAITFKGAGEEDQKAEIGEAEDVVGFFVVFGRQASFVVQEIDHGKEEKGYQKMCQFEKSHLVAVFFTLG